MPKPQRRRLRAEALESRRLLAGDLCGDLVSCATPAPALGGDAEASISSPSVQLTSVKFQAADAAGGSLSTAADLGQIDGTIQRNGRLSWFDQVDVARFEITQDSRVRFTLDRLSRDADLYVLDARGSVIASSTRWGRNPEALAGQLAAGEYYVAVSANSFWPMSYRLTIASESLSPPAPVTPTDGISPLSDVPDFGGSRDWNLNAVGAPEAWAAGYRGQGVTVAVIDTGVDLEHPDLVSNLFVNPGEIAGNGIDDDGNGYVDDVSGYDFVSRDAIPDDGNGHGTHVAGTIAAANDGVGATGVAPDAKILPVRVLNDSGSGSDFGVAEGIRYAAELGAEIINLSLGGSASSRIASAIEYATSLGSLVIAAAGNESAATPSHPARYSAQSSSVLSVGAYNSSNQIAGFSNDVGGSGAVQVDAPGVGIFSTTIGGGYASLSGTSMASPHVAGVAALTLSANPSLTSPELRQLLATGTVGGASGSDAIGNVSTLNSVAFAAAGLSTVGAASDGILAGADGTVGASVRVTGDVNPGSASGFLPQTQYVVASNTNRIERLDDAIASLDLTRTQKRVVSESNPDNPGSAERADAWFSRFEREGARDAEQSLLEDFESSKFLV